MVVKFCHLLHARMDGTRRHKGGPKSTQMTPLNHELWKLKLLLKIKVFMWYLTIGVASAD